MGELKSFLLTVTMHHFFLWVPIYYSNEAAAIICSGKVPITQ